LETRVYALKRYLFRLGHSARSGRFATSVEQLVVGVAPVMGWGCVPRDGAERARFVRAHRKSVQRWLDDLQAAGLVEHEPERDNRGQWWRTQIVLLAAPEPTPEELRVAAARARGWRGRERARRRRARAAPSLAAIRDRSAVPSASTCRRVARERAGVVYALRRRARVEEQVARAAAVRGSCGVLTHPFGAPPASATASVASEPDPSSATLVVEGSTAARSEGTVMGSATVVVETGARPRATAAGAIPAPAGGECSEEIESDVGVHALAAASPAILMATMRLPSAGWVGAPESPVRQAGFYGGVDSRIPSSREETLRRHGPSEEVPA
jgi:hypothetical protein